MIGLYCKRTKMLTQKEQRLQRIISQTHRPLLLVLLPVCKDRQHCDDILQETYIRLWQQLDNIYDDESLVPLLRKYARNILLDELRKVSVLNNLWQSTDQVENTTSSVEEILLVKQSYEQIQTAISKLPDQQQKIFRLHKEQAMSYRQIAGELGIATGTIEKQMGRALKFLRGELGHLYYGNHILVIIGAYYELFCAVANYVYTNAA